MSKINILTNSKINKLKPLDKEYIVTDGDKLYLSIKPNGSKLWLFIYTSPLHNKRRRTSIGTYPQIWLEIKLMSKEMYISEIKARILRKELN